MAKKNVIITGATGMVGGYALDYCLNSDDISKVTALVRKPTGKKHDKLVEIIHKDFEDFSAVTAYLTGQDVALFCIGVYTGAVSNGEFEKITVNYTVEFVNALLKNSGPVSFSFLSEAGADRSEKSRMVFARTKGIAENFLLKQDFRSLHILRPGYIYPVEKRKEPNLSYRVWRKLWPLLRMIFPSMGINSNDLGHAIADIGLHGGDLGTYENRSILEHVKKMKKGDRK